MPIDRTQSFIGIHAARATGKLAMIKYRFKNLLYQRLILNHQISITISSQRLHGRLRTGHIIECAIKVITALRIRLNQTTITSGYQSLQQR